MSDTSFLHKKLREVMEKYIEAKDDDTDNEKDDETEADSDDEDEEFEYHDKGEIFLKEIFDEQEIYFKDDLLSENEENKSEIE